MMPETRFTEFPALSVDSKVEISRSASKTDDLLYFTYSLKNRDICNKRCITANSNVIWRSSLRLRRMSTVFKELTSLLVSRISCLSTGQDRIF